MFDHSGARALGGLPRSRGGGGGDPGRHEAVEREMTKYVFYGSRSRIVEVEEELGSRKELFPISSQNATWDPIIKKNKNHKRKHDGPRISLRIYDRWQLHFVDLDARNS